MQNLGHNYTKRVFSIYLKFRFNRISYIFFPGNPNICVCVHMCVYVCVCVYTLPPTHTPNLGQNLERRM